MNFFDDFGLRNYEKVEGNNEENIEGNGEDINSVNLSYHFQLVLRSANFIVLILVLAKLLSILHQTNNVT